MDILTMPALEEMKRELTQIEEHTLKYSLADAIRDGAAFTEQNTENWYNVSENSACALSAAYLATLARSC